jgi:hypothetical protein
MAISEMVRWVDRSLSLPSLLPPLAQNDIASAQAFCHCSANCIQNCMGFITAIGRASAFGQLPAGLKLGKDFSFDSIAEMGSVI